MPSPFSRVVMWGHRVRPGCNTLAYCWAAYARAWEALGYETCHVADYPGFLLREGDLVMAEGQEDSHLHRAKGPVYVLHNCDWTKYDALRERCLGLQVYTHDLLDRDTRYLAPFTYHQSVPGCLGVLYQPWATNLLPHEINLDDALSKRGTEVVWVGTIGDGVFGNREQIEPFRQEAEKAGYRWTHYSNAADGLHRKVIREAAFAPTITGAWQTTKGYLPCRAWKNVSYGQPCLTNSTAVYEALDGHAMIEPDGYSLFRRAREYMNDRKTLREAMMYVQENHTFINRCKRILAVLA